MPELDVLREVTSRLRPPGYDDLVAVARRRRRHAIVGAAAGAAVLALAAVTAGGAFSGAQRAQLPAESPSPTASGSAPEGEAWTPERIRAEGSPVSFLGSPPAGLETQLYCTGQPIPTGSPCDGYHTYDPDEDQHWALEVARAGRSAVFEVRGTPWAADVDDDSILVQDGTDQAPRFRLLRVDGTAVRLRLLPGPAQAVPGPDVVLVQELAVYRRGMLGPDGTTGEHPYLLDDRAGTLRRLELPAGVKWWGSNVDEFLWGGNGCRIVWQQPDGGFERQDLECTDGAFPHSPAFSWIGWDDEWLEPGRMALAEYTDTGDGLVPLFLHVSLDRGASWQRVRVDEGYDLGEALQRLR